MKVRHFKLPLGKAIRASVDDLANAVCRADCALEALHIEGDMTRANNGLYAGADKNKSVKDLGFTATGLGVPQLLRVINMFESLVSLDLTSNNLFDLSVLDHLLLGEGRSLQTLCLRNNKICESDMKAFARKIPRMKFGAAGKSICAIEDFQHVCCQGGTLEKYKPRKSYIFIQRHQEIQQDGFRICSE